MSIRPAPTRGPRQEDGAGIARSVARPRRPAVSVILDRDARPRPSSPAQSLMVAEFNWWLLIVGGRRGGAGLARRLRLAPSRGRHGRAGALGRGPVDRRGDRAAGWTRTRPRHPPPPRRYLGFRPRTSRCDDPRSRWWARREPPRTSAEPATDDRRRRARTRPPGSRRLIGGTRARRRPGARRASDVAADQREHAGSGGRPATDRRTTRDRPQAASPHRAPAGPSAPSRPPARRRPVDRSPRPQVARPEHLADPARGCRRPRPSTRTPGLRRARGPRDDDQLPRRRGVHDRPGHGPPSRSPGPPAGVRLGVDARVARA